MIFSAFSYPAVRRRSASSAAQVLAVPHGARSPAAASKASACVSEPSTGAATSSAACASAAAATSSPAAPATPALPVLLDNVV